MKVKYLLGASSMVVGAIIYLIFMGVTKQDTQKTGKTAGNLKGAAFADEGTSLRQAGGADRSQLPLSQVVLFSSGVGYFQRQGPIEGNATIELRFSAADVNDLLKSMILEDDKGGKISAISYDGQDPVEKTLRSFALDLTMNPTLGQLLQQARGEKIEIVLNSNATPETGVILGMESQMQPGPKDTLVEVHQLNLVGPDGIRGLKLTDIKRMKFINPTLNEELRRALEVVATSHDQ